jgi:hypothetical protein
VKAAGAPLAALLLLSGCASGAAGRPCGDAEQNEWLSACAFGLITADRREHPPPTDPWQILTRATFASPEPLADHFVAACEGLMREPWRLAERDRPRLAQSGWPPVRSACTRAQRREWLSACETDVKALQGRTRRELLAVFAEEGGLSTRQQRTYVHRRCVALKVQATFRPVGAATAWGESLEDVVSGAAAFIDPFAVVD